MSTLKYKLIIELDTALHVGSGALGPESGIEEVQLNGEGEYCVPGTALAGLFFDRLGLLRRNKDEQLLALQGLEIIENGEEKKSVIGASHLVFRTATLPEVKMMVRDHVRINKKLKSAQDGSKFAQWQISPRINDNPLRLETICEIDYRSFAQDLLQEKKNESSAPRITQEVAKEALQKVFSSWHNEGLFIGAFASSGMGWARLVEVEPIYPCNCELDLTNHNSLFKKWKIMLIIKEEEDGYGTNGLLIRAGEGQLSYHYYKEPESNVDPLLDAVFIHDEDRLFIPGSSLKGALSFCIAKLKKEKKWLKDLFGQEGDSAGKIYFSDLFAEKYEKGNLLTIERHAEDEFTRAIYGGAKFDEERLFNTTFLGEIKVLKSVYKDHKQDIMDLINFLKELNDNRWFSLGAQACHPILKVEEV